MKSISPDPFRNEHIPWKRMRWHLRWVMFEAFWASALGLLNANTKLGSYWRKRVRQNVRLMQQALHSLLILSARAAPQVSFRSKARSAEDAGTHPSTISNADGWVPASARLTPLGGNDEEEFPWTARSDCLPPLSSQPSGESRADAGTHPASFRSVDGWVPASPALRASGRNDGEVTGVSDQRRGRQTSSLTPPGPKRDWNAWARIKLYALADIFADPTDHIARMVTHLERDGTKPRRCVRHPANSDVQTHLRHAMWTRCVSSWLTLAGLRASSQPFHDTS